MARPEQPETRAAEAPSCSDRLDGWKSIAAHLNRSVRTAIRWEKQLGLPVRRLHPATGEVVYAFRTEIDEWLRLNAPSALEAAIEEPMDAERTVDEVPAVPATRPSLWAVAAIIVVALGLGLTVGVIVAPHTRLLQWSARNPNAWRLDGNSIVIVDDTGQELWRHSSDLELRPEDYLRKAPPPDERMVLIDDIDGDGRREVLVRAYDYPPTPSVFRVFNVDGTRRFDSTIAGEVRFGETRYGPPFAVARMIVARWPRVAGAKIVIGAQHVPGFPAVVRMFSSDGRVLAEFWTNGHLGTIAAVQLAGRPIIAVGGVNNETRLASLAILDPSVRFAAAPAQSRGYRCTSCPGGPPAFFLLFPQSVLGARLGDMPYVTEVLSEADGGLRVRVVHHKGAIPGDPKDLTANAYYSFDDHLRLRSVALGDDFKETLARAAVVRLCKGLTPADVERSLDDVKIWKDTLYVPIERAR